MHIISSCVYHLTSDYTALPNSIFLYTPLGGICPNTWLRNQKLYIGRRAIQNLRPMRRGVPIPTPCPIDAFGISLRWEPVNSSHRKIVWRVDRWPSCLTALWRVDPYLLRLNGCMDQDVTIFDPFLLWPNGWMHQDATWYGCRPQPRGLCVRWRPTPHSQKGGGAPLLPNFRLMFIVAKRLDESRWHLALR